MLAEGESTIHFCWHRSEADSFIHCFGSAFVSKRIAIRIRIQIQLFASMRIRIRIQRAKPMRIHGDLDPDPSQIRLCRHKKLDLYCTWKMYFMLVKCHKKYLSKLVTKVISKGWNSRLFVDVGQFPWSWTRIRIRIPNSDLDPDLGAPNQCGSGSGSAKQLLAHCYNTQKIESHQFTISCRFLFQQQGYFCKVWPKILSKKRILIVFY